MIHPFEIPDVITVIASYFDNVTDIFHLLRTNHSSYSVLMNSSSCEIIYRRYLLNSLVSLFTNNFEEYTNCIQLRYHVHLEPMGPLSMKETHEPTATVVSQEYCVQYEENQEQVTSRINFITVNKCISEFVGNAACNLDTAYSLTVSQMNCDPWYKNDWFPAIVLLWTYRLVMTNETLFLKLVELFHGKPDLEFVEQNDESVDAVWEPMLNSQSGADVKLQFVRRWFLPHSIDSSEESFPDQEKVRVRVLKFMVLWLQGGQWPYPQSVQREHLLLTVMQAFCLHTIHVLYAQERQKKNDMVIILCYRLLRLAQKRIKEATGTVVNDPARHNSPLASDPDPNLKEHGIGTLLNRYSEKVFTRQLSILSLEWLSSLKCTEFILQGWKKNTPHAAPNIRRVAKLFSNMGTWFAASILAEKDQKKRALVIAKLTKISEKFLKINNILMTLVVNSGIQMSVINRMKETKKALPEKVRQQIQQFDTTFESIRTEQHQLTSFPLYVPFVGLYQTGCAVVDDSHPSWKPKFDRRIANYKKMVYHAWELRPMLFANPPTLSDIVEKLPKQEHKYWKKDEEFVDLFNKELDIASELTRQQLQTVSEKLEPSNK